MPISSGDRAEIEDVVFLPPPARSKRTVAHTLAMVLLPVLALVLLLLAGTAIVLAPWLWAHADAGKSEESGCNEFRCVDLSLERIEEITHIDFPAGSRAVASRLILATSDFYAEVQLPHSTERLDPPAYLYGVLSNGGDARVAQQLTDRGYSDIDSGEKRIVSSGSPDVSYSVAIGHDGERGDLVLVALNYFLF